MSLLATLALTCLFLSHTSYAPAQTSKPAPKAVKVKKSPAKKGAPKVSATPTAAAASSDLGLLDWTAEWKAKYVIASPKEDYTHVLIDVARMKDTFMGPPATVHAASAMEALYLSHSDILGAQSPDLVKCDVVIFEGRDNYGAPLWDSMRRIGHLEFSRKNLSQANPEVLQKDEAEWKNLFSKVVFY